MHVQAQKKLKLMQENICKFWLRWLLWIFLFGGLLGLSYGTDDQSLKDAFSNYGEVAEGEFWSNIVAVKIFSGKANP